MKVYKDGKEVKDATIIYSFDGRPVKIRVGGVIKKSPEYEFREAEIKKITKEVKAPVKRNRTRKSK